MTEKSQSLILILLKISDAHGLNVQKYCRYQLVFKYDSSNGSSFVIFYYKILRCSRLSTNAQFFPFTCFSCRILAASWLFFFNFMLLNILVEEPKPCFKIHSVWMKKLNWVKIFFIKIFLSLLLIKYIAIIKAFNQLSLFKCLLMILFQNIFDYFNPQIIESDPLLSQQPGQISLDSLYENHIL